MDKKPLILIFLFSIIANFSFAQGKTFFKNGTVAFDSTFRVAYYSTGKVAFNPTYNEVFYKNTKKAYHDNYKNVYYSNGEIAYNNTNKNVYYSNGLKAFDFRSKKVFTETGEFKGQLNKLGGGDEFVVESKRLKVNISKLSGKSTFLFSEEDQGFIYVTDFKTYFRICKGNTNKNDIINSIILK